jgi:hypothetical protein
LFRPPKHRHFVAGQMMPSARMSKAKCFVGEESTLDPLDGKSLLCLYCTKRWRISSYDDIFKGTFPRGRVPSSAAERLYTSRIRKEKKEKAILKSHSAATVQHIQKKLEKPNNYKCLYKGEGLGHLPLGPLHASPGISPRRCE